MRRLVFLALLSAGGLVVGCGDSPPTAEPTYDSAAGAGGGGAAGGLGGGAAGNPDGGLAGAGGVTGGAGGNAGGPGGAAGTGGAAGGAVALAPPAPSGLVSINTDTSYLTTSVSLLNTAGGLARGNCVHSTTANGGSSLTISNDAVLPSQPQRGGEIVLVDRGNGTLTFVDPVACFIARQVSIPGGATTDPHDVVIVNDHKAYVTRYQLNLASSSPQQIGNDVITIDPANNGTFLSRISVDAYAAKGAAHPVLARPDRALIAGGVIVVSLNQIDATYSAYGDGAVVVIDPATDAITASVSLPGLYDCEGMDYVPASNTLLVSCGGAYGDLNQPLESGIAVIDLGASPPRLVRVISSVAFDGRPMDFGWVVSAPTASQASRAIAGTYDPNGATADAVFEFDFVSGLVTPVTTAPPYAVGQPAVSNQLLLIPEAAGSAPKIQLFDLTTTPQSISAFAPDPANGFSARQVGWY